MGFGRRARRSNRVATITVLRRTGRPVIITAFPLKEAARDRLAVQLGDAEVLDIRDVVVEADLVLAPSCSPQVVGALKSAYPTARIIVVELEDWEYGVNFAGPVKRLLKAGADAYLMADSIDHLADQIRPRSNHSPDEAAEPPELVERSVDDVILASLHDVMRRRAEAAALPVRRSVDPDS